MGPRQIWQLTKKRAEHLSLFICGLQFLPLLEIYFSLSPFVFFFFGFVGGFVSCLVTHSTLKLRLFLLSFFFAFFFLWGETWEIFGNWLLSDFYICISWHTIFKMIAATLLSLNARSVFFLLSFIFSSFFFCPAVSIITRLDFGFWARSVVRWGPSSDFPIFRFPYSAREPTSSRLSAVIVLFDARTTEYWVGCWAGVVANRNPAGRQNYKNAALSCRSEKLGKLRGCAQCTKKGGLERDFPWRRASAHALVCKIG